MSAPAGQPTLFVHVDLDGLWTLPDCYGCDEGDTWARDPVYTSGLPRLLELFESLGMRATLFVVGRDLELDSKAGAIRAAARAGHEIANHSWAHRFDIELTGEAERRDRIARTQAQIEAVTGERPAGFRAPGYSAGPRTLKTLAELGLAYDGSAFPSRWGPALRWVSGRLRRRVQRQTGARRAPLPGGGRQFCNSGARGAVAAAHRIDYREAGLLWRFPVAVTPGLGLPLQASQSLWMGEARVADALTRQARRGPGGGVAPGPVTWLLHGLDAVAPEEFLHRLPPALARLRPLQTPLDRKLAFIRGVLQRARGEGLEIAVTAEWIKRYGDQPAETMR